MYENYSFINNWGMHPPFLQTPLLQLQTVQERGPNSRCVNCTRSVSRVCVRACVWEENTSSSECINQKCQSFSWVLVNHPHLSKLLPALVLPETKIGFIIVFLLLLLFWTSYCGTHLDDKTNKCLTEESKKNEKKITEHQWLKTITCKPHD